MIIANFIFSKQEGKTMLKAFYNLISVWVIWNVGILELQLIFNFFVSSQLDKPNLELD